MIKKYSHVLSHQIIELLSQLVLINLFSYGILEVNKNSKVNKTIMVIGYHQLDIQLFQRIVNKVMLHHISQVLDGTEELKYGIPISKLDIHSNIMMVMLIVYQLHQMVNIWQQVVEIKMSIFGISPT
jgi:hypothetical protein